MSTFRIFLEIITYWIAYPLLVYFTLHYAKESVTHELDRVENFIYIFGIMVILTGGFR